MIFELFFREVSEGPSGRGRTGYLSDSGPTQTDYSSQSDSESPHYFETRGRLKLPGKRKNSSARVGFTEGYQSDTGEYPSRRKFVRECTLAEYKGYHSDASGIESQSQEESNDSLSESPSPVRSRSNSRSPEKYFQPAPKMKRPSTIQIEFDELTPTSSVYFPSKSYAPTKFTSGSARKSDISSAGILRNQEVTKIMEGFSKIELAFNEEKASTSQARNPKTKKSPKVEPNAQKLRPKTSNPYSTAILSVGSKFPSAYLKGKGLLTKNPNKNM